MNMLNVGVWYKVRSLIDKATSNDDQITSGFIYNEINQLTYESDNHCQQVLDNLTNKLSYDKPIVKRKALLTIKSCLERGNPIFKRDLHHKMEDLRKASNYSGPPDKLEGDAPYKRVREEANKVMNLMYDTSSQKKMVVDNIEGKSSNMGNQGGDQRVFHNYQDGSNGINPGSNKIKLESYGNYMPTEKKSTTTKVFEMGSTVVNGVNNVTSFTINKIKTVITGKEEVKQTEYESKSFYIPPSNSTHDFSSTGNIKKLAEGSNWHEHTSRRQKGEVSDSWVSDHSDQSQQVEKTKPKFDYNFQSDFEFINDGSSTPNSSSNFNSSSPFNPSKSEKKRDENDDEEVDEAVEAYCYKLVDEITNPSGLRSTLDPSSVNNFLRRAEKLDVQIISFCLDTKLEEDNQKTILNSLTIIEALLNSNTSAYKYFLENTRNVENHTDSVNLQIKNKSTNIVGLLSLKQKAKKKKLKKRGNKKQGTNSPQTQNNNASNNTLNTSVNTTPNSNNNSNNNNNNNSNNNSNSGTSLLDFLNSSNTTPNTTSSPNLNVNLNVNINNTVVNQPKQENLLISLETPTTDNKVNNNSSNQVSILDDIKNLDISSKPPPLTSFFNNYSSPYPMQQPVYYPPYQQYPVHQQPMHYNNSPTLYNNLPQTTVQNDSKNDSAFSFINDEIKKEVK
eukprot:TRINITY_DN2074_c0_g1_i1.p1 TRINITY_DN2074_c0_g1~~TRINITY_DN2074_c0_g1_i1.p1  ORF type:complete len:674 (-),score=248.68 TRINITY_DN2074_c0_g1_i1:65-2086(-)